MTRQVFQLLFGLLVISGLMALYYYLA